MRDKNQNVDAQLVGMSIPFQLPIHPDVALLCCIFVYGIE
jgi:hypothetical protein